MIRSVVLFPTGRAVGHAFVVALHAIRAKCDIMSLSHRNGECPVEIASAQSEARGLKLCATCVNRKMHIRHVLMSQNASASVGAFCFSARMNGQHGGTRLPTFPACGWMRRVLGCPESDACVCVKLAGFGCALSPDRHAGVRGPWADRPHMGRHEI